MTYPLNQNSNWNANLFASDPYVDQTCCANIQCDKTIAGWLRDVSPASIRHSILPTKLFGIEGETDGKASREKEFAAGRFCTAQLLSHWNEDRDVDSAEDRSPCWPGGFSGSISHSKNWVWAAVARSIYIRSIGIDTENIVDEATRLEIQNEIGTDEEWTQMNSLGLAPETEFTILFSAKEAFYKCVYPVAKKYFDFKDVELESAQPGQLTIRPTQDNPIFDDQFNNLVIQYIADTNNVFTVTWMAEV